MSMNPEDFVDKTWRKLGAFEAALIQNYETHKGQPLNRTERLDLLRYIDDAVSAENPTPQQQMVLRVTRYKAIANQIASELTPGQLKSFVGDVGKHRLRRSLSHVDGLDMFGLGPPADPPIYSRSSREQINAYNRGTSFLPDDPAPGGIPLGPQGSTIPPFEPEPQMGQRPISLWDSSRNTRILEPGSTPFAMGPASSPVPEPQGAGTFGDYAPGLGDYEDPAINTGSAPPYERPKPLTSAEIRQMKYTLDRRAAEQGLPMQGDGPVTTTRPGRMPRAQRPPNTRMANLDVPPGLGSTLFDPLEGEQPGSLTQGAALNSWRDIIDEAHDPNAGGGDFGSGVTDRQMQNALRQELRLRPDDARAQMQAKNAAFSSPNAMPFPPDAPDLGTGIPQLGPVDQPGMADIPGTVERTARANRLRGEVQGQDLARAEAMLARMVNDPNTDPGMIRDLDAAIRRHRQGMGDIAQQDMDREFMATVTGQGRFRTGEQTPRGLGGVDMPPLPTDPEGLRAYQMWQNTNPEAGAESYSSFLGSRQAPVPGIPDTGDPAFLTGEDLGIQRRSPWGDFQDYTGFNRPGMPANDFDKVEGAPLPARQESSLENPWDPGGVRQLDPESGLPLSELEEPGVVRPRLQGDRFDTEGRTSFARQRPVMGLEDEVPRLPAPNTERAGTRRMLQDLTARQTEILAGQPAGVGVSPSQPRGLPLDMSSPGPSLAAPRGGAPSMTGAPDMTDLFSRLSQRLGKALPAINTGMTALGVGGNLLDLYGMNDFNKYVLEQNAQGGIPSSSGSRVPVDPGISSMYSGLGMAIPFLGSMMFDRNKFMDDPAYRDRFLYGDNVPVAS